MDIQHNLMLIEIWGPHPFGCHRSRRDRFDLDIGWQGKERPLCFKLGTPRFDGKMGLHDGGCSRPFHEGADVLSLWTHHEKPPFFSFISACSLQMTLRR
jgi:hypothetical protein